jgi:peroxiredoxin
LVVAFYNEGWGKYAVKILPKLKKLHEDTQKTGGTLLVLTQQPVDQLKALAKQKEISFTIGYDPENTVAKNFGAYDPLYPVWDRVAGISEDVVTPGIFVINRNETFAYAKLDKNFEMEWNEAILAVALSILSIKKEATRYA